MQDQRINIALFWMQKRLRNPTDRCKSIALPNGQRALIAGQNKIELHRPIPLLLGLNQRMVEHATRNPFSARRGRRNKAAIADMRTAPRLVWAYIIGSNGLPFNTKDKGGFIRFHPIGDRGLAIDQWVNRIGVTRAEHRL